MRHSQPNTIYDLNSHVFICEKCALFEEAVRQHSFIDAEALPAYVAQLLTSFTDRVARIQLGDNQAGKWERLRELMSNELREGKEAINQHYDRVVSQVEAERREKLN